MARDTTPAQFAAELAAAGAEAERAAAPVVKRGALNVKTQARKTVASSHSNPGKRAAAQWINFDMRGRLEAEIGYDKARAGNFGHMNEYGTSRWAPDRGLATALEVEADRMPEFLRKAVMATWQ